MVLEFIEQMYREQYEIEKAIREDGIAYINVWSTDCDGCSALGHRSFTTVEQFQEWYEAFYEWQEGPQGFDVTDKDHLNEEQSGGSWGDY